MLGYFVEEKIDISMSQNVALREIMTVVRKGRNKGFENTREMAGILSFQFRR